jgi:hypothetical protein
LEPISEFDGCDGGDLGNSRSPAIWLFGIEHGTFKSQNDSNFSMIENAPDYSIQTQLKWPYNQKAFKLLAAISGVSVDRYVEFALEKQPFVKHSKGYFKGNLYPYACRSVSDWPDDAKKETGMTKEQYRQWCKDHHLPKIKKWADKYTPKVFIGVGITHKSEFSTAFFGNDVDFNMYKFSINGHEKKIFYKLFNSRKLVVIPHLSGSRHGLNSNESLQIAGKFIANFLGTDSENDI